MVVEARDIDLQSKLESGSEHPNIHRALIVEEPIVHLKDSKCLDK